MAHPNRRPPLPERLITSELTVADELHDESSRKTRHKKLRPTSKRRRENANHSPNTKNLSYTKQIRRRLPDSPSPRRRTGHRRRRNQRNRRQEHITLEAPLSTIARGKKEASRKVIRFDPPWAKKKLSKMMVGCKCS
jgi:hypothetical protein